MDRRFVTAAFVVAALLPQALAAQTTSSNASKTTSSSKTTTHINNNHATSGKSTKRHHRHESPWSRNVIVTGVNAQDYLTPTATPKPPAKNKVNTGGTVFKSIGN